MTAGDADRVAAAVGDLPLAIDQAGLLLATTPLDVPTYLQLLVDRAADTFDHDPRAGTRRRSRRPGPSPSTSCTRRPPSRLGC